MDGTINSLSRRIAGSSSLIFIDSGMRRNDEKTNIQIFLNVCSILFLFIFCLSPLGDAAAQEQYINDPGLDMTACLGSVDGVIPPKLLFHELGYNPETQRFYYPALSLEGPGPVHSDEYLNLTSEGWRLVNNCTIPRNYWVQFVLLTGGYFPSLYEYGRYILRGSSRVVGCEREGNPCSPVSGNKTQREKDVKVGNVKFIRYYNSQGENNSSRNLAPGWRHTYDRRLNQSPSNTKINASPIQSQYYSSPKEACYKGWIDIRGSIWGGVYSSSGLGVYKGNYNCQIIVDGETVGYLNVSTQF